MVRDNKALAAHLRLSARGMEFAADALERGTDEMDVECLMENVAVASMLLLDVSDRCAYIHTNRERAAATAA